MRSNRLIAALALPALLAGCARDRIAGLPPTRLHAEAFGTHSRPRVLIVVLHAGEPARVAAAYGFARDVASEIGNSTAYVLLRPGFADDRGHRSAGDPGTDAGDGYTSAVIGAVGETIATLRAHAPGARVVLVGDRGGAAIAADLAGLKPGLVDGMVLVSCPCALPEWRAYMAGRDRSSGANSPQRSLDPLRTVGGAMPGLKAAILVGAEDKVTPVRFSRPYAESLALRGIDTDYRILPGKADAILGDPQVLDATRRIASALMEKR